MYGIKRLAPVLLGIWLILMGASYFLKGALPYVAVVVPLLAVFAGLSILATSERPAGRVGLTLLGIYLLAYGLMPFLKYSFAGSAAALSVLAAVSGILIIFKR